METANHGLPPATTAPAVMEQLPPPSTEYVQNAESRSLSFLNPKLFQAMKVFIGELVQGTALPAGIKNAGQAMMVLQRGYELGMQPVQALQSIAIINGRLSLWGEAAIAQVERNGFIVEWGECNAQTATVTITNKETGKSSTGTFTMQMAKDRGLYKAETYAKFPENMLRFKAFHLIAKFIAASAFHNMEVAEIVSTETEPIKISHAEVTTIAQEPRKSPDGTNSHSGLKEALASKPAVEETKPEDESEGKKKKSKKVVDGEISEVETEKVETESENKAKTNEPEETDQAKFYRLFEKRKGGNPLTNSERMFMAKHEAQGKTDA